MGKILHFNHDARRRLQAGVDELALVVARQLTGRAGDTLVDTVQLRTAR